MTITITALFSGYLATLRMRRWTAANVAGSFRPARQLRPVFQKCFVVSYPAIRCNWAKKVRNHSGGRHVTIAWQKCYHEFRHLASDCGHTSQ